jgi:hypothetical protein
MLPPGAIFWGFVLPGLVVAAALAVGWQVWRKEGKLDGRWVNGPAIAGAFALAFWDLQPNKPWPAGAAVRANVENWIFYFAIIVAALSLMEGLGRPRRRLGAIILVILWHMAAQTLLNPLIPRTVLPKIAELWIDGAVLTVLVWWLTMQSLAQRIAGITVPLVMGIVTGGTAVTLLSWHLIGAAMLAGVIGVFCAVVFILAAWRRRVSLSHGGVTAMVASLQLLVVYGYFYSPDTFGADQNVRTGLLMASPLLAFVGDLPGVRRWRPGWRLASRVIPLLILVGIVVGFNVRAYLADAAAQASQMDE